MVDAKLSDLESINKLYRQLAREGRSDAAGEMKDHVQRVNDRYDALLQQVKVVGGQVSKHTGRDAEFEDSLSEVTAWLNDLEARLTRAEQHSTESLARRLQAVKVSVRRFG